MDIYEGKLEIERVSDTGYNNMDFQLCLGFDTVENIFKKYKNSKVRITVEILPEEDDEEDEI